MRKKFLNVVGLMSGTSMDGIDLSYVKTNGITLEIIQNFFYPYDRKERRKLENILSDKKKILKNKKLFIEYNQYISKLHLNSLKEFISSKKIDLIGFHGQTIYHNPKIKRTVQLGDPTLLAKEFNTNVIYSFRSTDVENGGEGAPIAPIYHKFLMKKHNFKLPSCIVNIGGISNLSYWDGINLLGFDVGPGNCLLDDYMKIKENQNFDRNGTRASKGSINKDLVENFLDDPFFKRPPPKSLDREYFKPYLQKMLNSNLSTHDAMATLLDFTLKAFINSLKYLPNDLKSLLICGGGKKNKYLTSKIKQNFRKIDFVNNDYKLDTDFIESEMIAYLATRSLYSLPITFPKTTGVNYESTGGKLYKKPN